MKRELELTRRLASLTALGEAVRGMKSLSAHHFREARGGVELARAYHAGVERIVHLTGARLEAGRGPAGVLVLGGELGLCGAYNAQIVAKAVARRGELGAGPTFVVGRRTRRLLLQKGVAIERGYDAPTSLAGITRLLLPLAEDVLVHYAAHGLSSLEIVSSRFSGVGSASPESLRFLPLEPSPQPGGRARSLQHTEHLASSAIREFLYATLHTLLLDALASEHAARLLATQSAEKWLDERTETLRRRLASSRRETSTQEILEIATAARQVTGQKTRRY